MIKSKAIEIIKKFSGEEKESFKLFLDSPYFNKKKKVFELYALILKYFNKLEEKDSTEEKIFAGLFKGKEFSYSFMRNLMSELFQLCERFLVFNFLNKNFESEFFSNGNLLAEYNKRFLDNLHEIKRKKVAEFYKESKINFEHYYEMYLFEYMIVNYHIFRNQKEMVPEHMISRSEYNLCYFTQLLEIDLNDLNAVMTGYNLNLSEELVFEFIKNINVENFLERLRKKRTHINDELAIRLLSILLIIKPGEEKNFYELKKLGLKLMDKYTDVVRYNFLTKLKNYCNERIRSGSLHFKKEKYHLLKLESEVVNYGIGGVSPLQTMSFLYTVEFALGERDIKFAEQYINIFTQKVEATARESVSNLAKALIEFEKKNYEKVIEHLSGVEQINNYVKNLCKIVYLKTYYEIDISETAFSMLDSYIHYINENDEFSDVKKDNLRKDHHIFSRLIKIKTGAGKSNDYDIGKLEKEIDSSNSGNKNWFSEKTKELRRDVR